VTFRYAVSEHGAKYALPVSLELFLYISFQLEPSMEDDCYAEVGKILQCNVGSVAEISSRKNAWPIVQDSYRCHCLVNQRAQLWACYKLSSASLGRPIGPCRCVLLGFCIDPP
jgi:hypothetical protein